MADRRGTKRHCIACGANYYDLGRSPAHCPKCGAEWQPPMPLRPSIRKVPPPEAETVEEEHELEPAAGHEETAETEESEDIDEVEEVEDLPGEDEEDGFASPEDEAERD